MTSPGRLRASRLSLSMLLCLSVVAVSAGCGRRLIGSLPVDAAGSGGSAASGAGGGGGSGGVDARADSGAGADVAADAGPPDGPPVAPELPQLCTSEGWCWTHPLPTSDRFVQAFEVGPDDLWLIGASGTVIRYTGGKWSALPSPTYTLSAIWASASDDVLVGGLAGAWRWNGQAWMQAPLPADMSGRAVYGIWGCAADDVWTVGPATMHWDGTQWTFVNVPAPPIAAQTGAFRAVWGTACDDVWVGSLSDSVGAGRILHWDGNAWTQTEGRPVEQLGGTGPDDVWSLVQGQLFRWSGLGPGTLQDSRTLSLFRVGTTAIGTLNDDHVVSLRGRDGGTSPSVPAPDAVRALWGRSASDIWGVGAQGTAAHWNGQAWTTLLPGWTLGGGGDATKVTGSSPTELWAVAGSTLLKGDGSTWQVALTSQQVGGRVYDVWARASDDVWVLGGDAVIHRWNGSVWSTIDPTPRGATTPEMRVIAGTGPEDVWVVRGMNSVLHWDGSSWISRQPSVGQITDIWAPGPNELWAVGDTVAHWQGSGWFPVRRPQTTGDTPFTAVGGGGPNDVWALSGGYVFKVSADFRDLVSVMSSSWRATALSSVGVSNIWVLFQNGTDVSRLYRLTSTDPSGIGPGVIAPSGLNDLWAIPDGTLWAAGSGGALIRRLAP